jgi:hypothetical protein
MSSKKWRLLLPALIAAGALLLLVALAASPSGATVTGKPVPPLGSDWVIDQDTRASGETAINLKGNIIVQSGFTLEITNSNVIFNSTLNTHYGIRVNGGGMLKISDTNIKALNMSKGWTFTINGGASLKTGVKLLGVYNGVYIYNDNVEFDDVEVRASGTYGMYIYSCSPTIKNTKVYNEAVISTPWQSTTYYYVYLYSQRIYGMKIDGSPGNLATPTLDNVFIFAQLLDQWNHTTISRNRYTRYYMYAYGLEISYADVGLLSNVEIRMNMTLDATLNRGAGTSYNYQYFYAYVYPYAFRMYGECYLDGFKNVSILNSTYHVDIENKGFSWIRLYYYYGENSGQFLNEMNSGRCPAVASGITIMGHFPTYTTTGSFSGRYEYYRARVFRWRPSTGTNASTEVVIDGITIDGAQGEYFIEIPDWWDITIRNCTFINNKIGSNNYYGYLFYTNSYRHKILIEHNQIVKNDMPRGYLFQIYYQYADYTISENNISDNKLFYFMYIYRNQNGVTISIKDNDITHNTIQQYIVYSDYLYGPVKFTENNISFNTGTSYWFYSYRIQSSGYFTFEENEVHNNSAGYLFYDRYSYGSLDFIDNVVANSSFSSYMFYSYRTYGADYTIRGNNITNCRVSNGGFYFYYLGYSGHSEFEISRNEFYMNTGATALTSGLIRIEYPRQNIEIRNNYFENNTANGISFYRIYGGYWFYIESNEFVNNSGKGIVFDYLDNPYLQIKSNKAHGNFDYPVYLDQTYRYVNGPNEVKIENNNFSYNPGGGVYLKLNYIPYYSYYWNPNQAVSIKNNDLSNNGNRGWSLALEALFKKPSMNNNDITGSAMGQYMGMTDDPRRKEFTMEIREFVTNGGPNGTTAFGFSEIDANIYDSSLLNYTECLYAKNCEVNAYWSAIPEASGRTEGKGRIFVWNHLEIWVNWGNASAVDSGFAVPNATVAMRGANAQYMDPFKTDEEGKYGPFVLNPWTCIDGIMNALAPFDAAIIAQGVSSNQILHVVGELVGPHNPAKLLLVDYRVPDLIFSNPQNGTLVNTADLLVEGFLFELGSGVVVFEGRTSLMAPDEWTNITQELLWKHVFEDVPEGNLNVTIRAADLSGNWNSSTISIVIDLTTPELNAWLEFKDATVIPGPPYSVRVVGIVINGTYNDNIAELEDVAIRINGETKEIFVTRLGTIYEYIDLGEGLNILIIDATDTAGNRKVIELQITLDKFAPTLYVYFPLQNDRTGSPMIEVTGLSEPGMDIVVDVEAVIGSNSFTNQSTSDGTFIVETDLFEGHQKVIVSVTDKAGNVALVARDIDLDMTPPDFEMVSPSETLTITKDTQYTLVGRMTFEPDAEVYINGQLVENPGIFSRTLVLQEGENPIEVQAIDKVGNEKVWNGIIIRDTSVPVLEVTSPEGDFVLIKDPTVHFAGTVSGAKQNGVKVEHPRFNVDATLLSGNWDTGGTWEAVLELGPEDIEQYVTVRAVDQAGNEILWTVHMVYDIIPPALYIEAVPTDTDRPVININGTTDEEILVVMVGEMPFPVKDGIFNIKWTLSPENNTIPVTVSDEAGNSRSEELNVFYEYKPHKPPEVEGDKAGLPFAWSVAIIVAAVTVFAVAGYLSSDRSKKGVAR